MTSANCPVLFVMAPGGGTRYFSEHLGTAFLRAVLGRAGIASRQYTPKTNPSLSGFANDLRELKPHVLGFTVYESNLNVSRAMIRVARETLPGSVIAVGGPNATFTPEETLKLLSADLCLRGAGEGTIVSLVQRILGSASVPGNLLELLNDVPNLVLRTPNGESRTPLEDISSFPAKYFATLDDIPSPFQDNVVSTPDIGYLSARGCNQHCTYCSFAALSGRRVAFHSVERVLDDLAALQILAANMPRRHADIWILDDAFTLAPERVRRICEGMLRRRIRLPLRCETRGDRVTPDLLRLMRRAGFVGIAFGLESAVPRVLRAIGKVCMPLSAGDEDFEPEEQYLARFRSAVKSARQCGLNVNVSVIAGLPSETAEDFRTTLQFVSSLKVGMYLHNALSLFPGTPLYNKRRAFGLDAFRDSRTAIWRTVHSYAVTEIQPLSNSHVHRFKWMTAQTLADALCGRAGIIQRGKDCVWSVVIHGHPRSRKLAAWLRRILAIDGVVVVFDHSRDAAEEWRIFLTHSRVPFGDVISLLPDPSTRGNLSYDALGSTGEHHVRFLSAWSPDVANEPIEADEDGNCRISIWLGSAPDAEIGGRTGWKCPSIGPGLQVADSCRVSSALLRCRRPQVFHVDSEGGIRACWYGPSIGAVGDGLAKIVRAAVTSAETPRVPAEPPPRCPLPLPRGVTDETRDQVWDSDVASQLSWIFSLRSNAQETVETVGQKGESLEEGHG